MKNGISVGTRLTAYVASLLALVLVVGTTATMTAWRLDASARSIGGKWLAGTHLLDELSDEVARFRFAELDRALARTSSADPQADVDDGTAAARRASVASLARGFQDLLGPDGRRVDVTAFLRAWDDYLVVHDAWLRADVYRHAAGLARSKSSLDWRYKGLGSELARLKAASFAAAGEEVGQATRLAGDLDRSVTACFAVATLLALLVLVDVRRRIVGPLRSMTAALTRLAAGNLDFAIPEAHRRDEIGQLASAFEVFRANAAELEAAHARTRAAQVQADALARHDALTGLPNRRAFAAEVAAAVDRARRTKAGCALLLVDLDRFKPVNDARGHKVGDLVLCEVARRLEAVPAPRRTVARLGGDEFAVVLDADGPDAAVEASRFADEALRALRAPFEVGDLRIEIGASVGIACSTDAGSADDLVHGADLAMYRAKRDGRDRYRFFEAGMDADLRDQVAIDDDLRTAIAAGAIEPHYQPLVDLGGGGICGFEVLARWTHPERGAVPPDRFIAAAERLGLISDLMAGLLRRACRDAWDWGDSIRLAVNVSPCQIVDPSFPDTVLGILAEQRFPTSRLEIEVTESALVEDIGAARAVLASLQERGITVSLDDFGTGYSSLYHLRNLKFDKLKIDRSFVQSVHRDIESAKIVDAVLGLARSLGLPVVAEGIEDGAVMAHLVERGCEYGQGYLFSKAVGAEEARRMLVEGRMERAAASAPAAMRERLRDEFARPSRVGEADQPDAKAVA